MKTVEITDQVRPFHPSVLAELPIEVALELKQVGLDLASGVIPSYQFDMSLYNQPCRLPDGSCGTAYCIAGWVAFRMRQPYFDLFYQDGGPARERYVDGVYCNTPMRILFCRHPSDPQMAARAVEEYLYNYADDPWKAAGYVEPKDEFIAVG